MPGTRDLAPRGADRGKESGGSGWTNHNKGWLPDKPSHSVIRKRVEEIIGWAKTIGGLRRSRYRGVERTQEWGHFVVSSYNLLRMARLEVAAGA